MKKLSVLLLITIIFVAGCQTTTPIDYVSVQNTAVAVGNTAMAMAWTSVSQTQIASTVQPTHSSNDIPTKSAQPTAKYSSGGNSNSDTSWFKGGTLHKSLMKEWRQATYSNRLATSADFIAATQNVDYGNLDRFKQMATDLETCISTTAVGGAADNEKTAFISAMCMVELFPK